MWTKKRILFHGKANTEKKNGYCVNSHLLCLFFFGQVEIFSGKQTFDITFPTGKLLKKLISTCINDVIVTHKPGYRTALEPISKVEHSFGRASYTVGRACRKCYNFKPSKCGLRVKNMYKI